MEITREFLVNEIKRMEQQRQHAHEVAIASQAALDVMNALVARLDQPEDTQPNTQEHEHGSVQTNGEDVHHGAHG